VLDRLSLAAEHGLDLADYDASALAKRWATLRTGGGTPAQGALFDLGLTTSLARLVAAVHLGRVDPTTLLRDYAAARRPFDPAPVLRELRAGEDLGHALAVLEPPYAHYSRARRTLANLRTSLASGEPPRVPEIEKPLPP